MLSHFLEKVNGQIDILINDFSINPAPRSIEKDKEILKNIGVEKRRNLYDPTQCRMPPLQREPSGQRPEKRWPSSGQTNYHP